MESRKMCRSIIVVILIPAFAFKGIEANIIGRNGSFTRESKGLLEDTVNRVNDSLIQHHKTIQGFTDDAFNNPLILDVDDKVSVLIAEQNATLAALETSMTLENDAASALGPEYAHCVQIEAAAHIVRLAVDAMGSCAVPAQEFLQEYASEMEDYVRTTQAVSQYAYTSVFECLPGGEDPSEEEIDEAVRCINYEQFGAHHSLNLLEQMLVSNQYNNKRTAQSLFTEATVCVDEEVKLTSIQAGKLVSEIDACIAGNLKRSRRDQKVTVEDLQAAIDEANATLTNTYELISDNLDDLMDSEFIDDVISETNVRIGEANETIIRMSNATFKILDETEAGGNYGDCLVGVREKAQSILDQAVAHLPQCVSPLEDLDQECHKDVLSLVSELEAERLIAQSNVMACLPSGDDHSEEEISVAISCVDSESLKAQRSLLVLQLGLLSLIEDTVSKLDVLTYDARWCVDTSAHVAGDQTGYLRFVLDQCLTAAVSTSTTDNPRGGSTGNEVTLTDLQDALDRSNASLQEFYAHIDEEINYALNSQTVLKAVSETNTKIASSEEPLVKMSELVEAKISETEAKNFSDCVQGVRETSLSLLEDAIDTIRECATPIEELANVYEEQILSSVERFGDDREAPMKRVYDCVPPGPASPAPNAVQDIAACVDRETLSALHAMSLQQRNLRAGVERANRRATTLSADAAACVDHTLADTALDVDDLIQDVAECMQVTDVNTDDF